MWTQEQIEALVHHEIQREHKLGDQAGGSGHLAHVSYTLEEINPVELEPGKWEIHYSYKVRTLSEFEVATDFEEEESEQDFPSPPSSVQKTGVLSLPK